MCSRLRVIPSSREAPLAVSTQQRAAVPGLFEQQRSKPFAPTEQVRQCAEPLQLPGLKAATSPRALRSRRRCTPRTTTACPSSAQNTTLRCAFITLNHSPGFKAHPSELEMWGARRCLPPAAPSQHRQVPGHAHAPLSSAQRLPCSKGKGNSAEDAGVLGVFPAFWR